MPEFKEMTARDAHQYVLDNGSEPCAEAEYSILKCPIFTKMYAQNILKKRWILGEEVIIRSPEQIVLYCINVIEGTWGSAEEVLLKDARDDLAKLKADPNHEMQGTLWAYWYCENCMNLGDKQFEWPELEEILLEHPNGKWAWWYVMTVRKSAWPEIEHKLNVDDKRNYDLQVSEWNAKSILED